MAYMRIDKSAKQHMLQALAKLKQQHRDLDITIQDLNLQLNTNQLEIKRLKKNKLALKDAIAHLESKLIPDLHA